MNKKRYLVLTLLIVASVVLSACGGGAQPETPAATEAPTAASKLV